MQQVTQLHDKYNNLQSKYGDPSLSSIYGGGNIDSPEIMFVFMNPTGKNISSNPSWNGLRAPWIGTKQVWDIFYKLGFLSENIYTKIKEYGPNDWDIEFSNRVYKNIENSEIFITNLAKCTQIDSRPLSSRVFREYLDLMYKEIDIVKPKKIVTFGNQVSSILLGKNISVSMYKGLEVELFRGYHVYPTYYPVGQGRRNMPLAIERIKRILSV
jgi:uracil-DNA glycosylase